MYSKQSAHSPFTNWPTTYFQEMNRRINLTLANFSMIECFMNSWLTTKFILVHRYTLMSFEMQQINSLCNTLSRYTKLRVHNNKYCIKIYWSTKTWISKSANNTNRILFTFINMTDFKMYADNWIFTINCIFKLSDLLIPKFWGKN